MVKKTDTITKFFFEEMTLTEIEVLKEGDSVLYTNNDDNVFHGRFMKFSKGFFSGNVYVHINFVTVNGKIGTEQLSMTDTDTKLFKLVRIK